MSRAQPIKADGFWEELVEAEALESTAEHLNIAKGTTDPRVEFISPK